MKQMVSEHTCFAHDGQILDALQQDGEEEWNYCEEIYKIHSTEEEFNFLRTAKEPQEIFQSKVDGADIIHQVNDEGHLRVLRGSRLLVNLELVQGWHDEGNGGHDHNCQAHQCGNLEQ